MTTWVARKIARFGVLVATALAIGALTSSLGFSRNVQVARLSVPTLGEVVHHSAGGLTVPTSWSGIWATQDTLRLCSDPMVLFAEPGSDTLCTGEAIEEEYSNVTLDCTGSIDDDSANIHCTGSEEVSPGCRVDYDLVMLASRNGDDYFFENTINATYDPSFCDASPDGCFVLTSTGHRQAPEPPTCSTPVEPGTWGMIKSRYR